MRVTFLGSGDAFGSGGRFNTCIHVADSRGAFLIDCGASSLIAMRRYGVDPNAIETVFVSHLHGDHFGGLPFLILDAQLVSRRTAPLTIAGPPGIRERLDTAMETFFPGSTSVTRKFVLDIVELAPDAERRVGAVSVTPYRVNHPCGAPPFALRLACGGKIVAYSGDTEWTDALLAAASGADLFIAEAYFYDRKIRYHLDYATLCAHLPKLAAKRVILTHMSVDMLGRLDGVDLECAEDGKCIAI